MGKTITQGGGGPSKSGEQGVPGGGNSTVDETTGTEHHSDYSKDEPHEHNSWDERSGNVSNEHTTTAKKD